jgi:hypothetical protein
MFQTPNSELVQTPIKFAMSQIIKALLVGPFVAVIADYYTFRRESFTTTVELFRQYPAVSDKLSYVHVFELSSKHQKKDPSELFAKALVEEKDLHHRHVLLHPQSQSNKVKASG